MDHTIKRYSIIRLGVKLRTSTKPLNAALLFNVQCCSVLNDLYFIYCTKNSLVRIEIFSFDTGLVTGCWHMIYLFSVSKYEMFFPSFFLTGVFGTEIWMKVALTLISYIVTSYNRKYFL